MTPASTWPDSVRVAVGARARRVLVEHGSAVGVDAGNLRVRARAVVVACGAFQTPALLARSGLRERQHRRNLHLHPVTLLAGEMEEDVNPWEDHFQSRYSDEHAARRRLRGAVRDATGHARVARRSAPVGRGGGRARPGATVRAARAGVPARPRPRRRRSRRRPGRRARRALPHLALRPSSPARGFAGAARVLEAAGARRIVATHARPLVWERGRGGIGRFLAEADMRGWAPNQVLYARRT